MDSVAGRAQGAMLADLPALALTAAEFLALADALGERPPAPVLAELADLTRRQRQEALDEAVRSLLARKVLIAGDPIRIALAAARLVQITCRPALRTEVRWGAPGVPEQVVRIASVTDASVAAVSQDGMVRYLPFATEQLLGFLDEVLDVAVGGDGCWGLVSAVYRDGVGRRSGGEVAWIGAEGALFQVSPAHVPPSPDRASAAEETSAAAEAPGAAEGDGVAERSAAADAASDGQGPREPTTRAQLIAAVAELLPGTASDRAVAGDGYAVANV
jgi:hypothetical protein